MASRWLRFILVILIGIATGLLYAWVIDPVEYVDTSPTTLKADYKTDYVLMVAESFQAEQDVPLAISRLAFLEGSSPEESIRQAIQFVQRPGYSELDRTLLRELLLAVRTESLSEETPAL